MPVQLTIPPEAYPGLALIAEHSKKLPALRAIVDTTEAGERNPGVVAKAFSEKTGVSARDARQMFTQLVAMHALRSRYEISPSEFFDSISESVANDPRAKGAIDEGSWRAARKDIEEALDSDSPFYVLQKNVQLVYEHQNVLYDVKILTDIRPIFDDSGSDLKQMTISHMMEIEYYDGTDQRKLFFALDAADVKKLQKACQRAETKTATLRNKMASLAWPVEVFGEHLDE